MDINEAVTTVDKFLREYNEANDEWNPIEIRVLPSGDENDEIKVWFNFGSEVVEAELEALKGKAEAALTEAHAEVMKAFTVEVRADAI